MANKMGIFFENNEIMPLRNNETVCLKGVHDILSTLLRLKREKCSAWELRIFMAVFCNLLGAFIYDLKREHDDVVSLLQ